MDSEPNKSTDYDDENQYELYPAEHDDDVAMEEDGAEAREGERPGNNAEPDDERAFPRSRQRSIKELVQKAAEGLGHPHQERFLRILTGAKASQEVIQAAKDLNCSVCKKFSRTKPPRRELGINEIVGADTLWLPTVNEMVRVRKLFAGGLSDLA